MWIRVVDKTPPVPVCREITQLALSNGANGDELCARLLDEGSYDECSPGVHFYVRRMINADDFIPEGATDPDNPVIKLEIPGVPGGCASQPFGNVGYKYVKCTEFTCDDIGQDNQVFLLVVDDWMQSYLENYIRIYWKNQCPFFPSLNPCTTPWSILPDGSFYLAREFEIGPPTPNPTTIPGLGFEGIPPTANLFEGHYNFCMVQVLVEDKYRPTCTPPADVWTDCTQIPDNVDLSDTDELSSLFGTATATDNCAATIEELDPDVDVDFCGVGQVLRRFRARDTYGNASVGLCRQTIMIMPINEYKITLPRDYSGECIQDAAASLTYVETGCDLLAINTEVEYFDASHYGDGTCYKKIITYKIINWCEYDGFSDPTAFPRIDNNSDGMVGDGYMVLSNGDYLYYNTVVDPNNRLANNQITASKYAYANGGYNPAGLSWGYYTYKQHVKVYDDTAPALSYSGDTDFCGGEINQDPCTGQVDIIPDVFEECTPDDIRYEWALDAFNNGVYDFDGDGALSGRYPLGHHRVHFWVYDDCGNTSEIDIEFDVYDCKAPTPVCINGLSADLQLLSQTVTVWASDWDASSFDYCHDFDFYVNEVEDLNGDGFITADDYLTSLPNSTSATFDCDDVGVINYVQVWVHELSGDGYQDDDFCVTFIEITDNLGACDGSRPSIGGKITNEEDESVQSVSVDLSGQMSHNMITSADGEYVFTSLDGGYDYTVTPTRDDDPRNGVSTYDLVLISKHILNVEKLNSPYKIIAADANNSGNVSTLDLVALRKLVLRVSDELPNNTSWRFVDKSYVFPNPENPWTAEFPEVININNLSTHELAANFFAIKVGDVNGNSKANDLLGVDDRTFKGNLLFNVEEASVKAGEEFTVDFVANANVLGYQFTLEYNNSVEVVDIIEAIAGESNFHVMEGSIATSWNEDKEIAGAKMFSVVFRAVEDVNVSEVMNVSSSVTEAEAYNRNGELMGVALEFNSGVVESDFDLYQNTPNPFRGETTIGFNLPEASTATLTITDVSGKVLQVVEGQFTKGYNEVTLKRSEMGAATGVLTYQLDTDSHSATKKMIIIE
jgi:hypothetical protein